MATPCRFMSGTGTQNGKIILKIRVGTCKFTWNGIEILHIGRYSGLIWHNLGLRILNAQAVFPLSTNEG
jgi:hypothetical protein